MRMIHRQHVDADALAQFAVQRQPYLQGVQGVDPDGQGNHLRGPRRMGRGGAIKRGARAAFLAGNHGVWRGGGRAGWRVSGWLMTIPL
ncbi:hypothetical protein MyNCGM152_32840 [Achromobacter xylosoxidans]